MSILSSTKILEKKGLGKKTKKKTDDCAAFCFPEKSSNF